MLVSIIKLSLQKREILLLGYIKYQNKVNNSNVKRQLK